MNVLAELRARFEAVLAHWTDEPATFAAMVKPTQDSRFGDFQANCAMPLANQKKLKPRELAQQIVERLDVSDICEDPEIAGPGFINLRLKDSFLAETTNRLVTDDRFGVATVEDPRHYVVDYSSPNVAKPMHVGHLRSTVIGNAILRILRFQGHRVTGDNHIGDWGTQFGMIIYGYKHFLDSSAYEQDPVQELARLYRLVNQLCDYHQSVARKAPAEQALSSKQDELAVAESDPSSGSKEQQARLKKLRSEVADCTSELGSIEKTLAGVDSDPQLSALAAAHPGIVVRTREETAQLHAGDAENLRLWKQFLPPCVDALQAVYDRLGISFDIALGESFYHPMLADVARELEEKGIARHSEGALCVFIPGTEAPFIIRKADSAFTYATTDLATVKYRVQDLNCDAMLYVVGQPQSAHFHLLFETARQWGFDEVELTHVAFGTVLDENRRAFRTRAGGTVGLESLLDEAVTRARAIVDENDESKPSAELDEATRADVAEAVGIGGIKYADLRHNRDSDYVFNWEKMLAKNGDTATYIQYAYARICGIFRKGDIDRAALRQTVHAIRLDAPAERAIALQLNRFVDAIDQVAREYRPNLLTQYLFETANVFSSFYESCPVLPETDEAIRTSRLKLCDLTARVLSLGLSLLGIRTCERM